MENQAGSEMAEGVDSLGSSRGFLLAHDLQPFVRLGALARDWRAYRQPEAGHAGTGGVAWGRWDLQPVGPLPTAPTGLVRSVGYNGCGPSVA